MNLPDVKSRGVLRFLSASFNLASINDRKAAMSGIQRLLSILRRLILGNTFVRASIRVVLLLFSTLRRIITGKRSNVTSSSAENSNLIRNVYPQTTGCDDGDDLYPRESVVSASSMPVSLHPYSSDSPSAARSSQEITVHAMIPESYPMHSLSIEHLPSSRPPSATVSMQNLPALPPSPNIGLNDYYVLPSNNSSVVDPHLPGPATEFPIHSRCSSGVIGDVEESSPPCLNDVHPRICPATPDMIGRYNRKVIIPNEPTKFILKPLTIRSVPNPPPPCWTGCWTPCQHPEGAQYFFHEEKRVFTDANLFDANTLTFINDNMRTVLDFLQAHNVDLDPGVDLVLDEFLYDDGSKGCQYYFVNHQDRCVFWMDYCDSNLFPVTAEVKGMSSASHIRHELEAQYWLHCEYYPLAFEVTHVVVDELRDIVLHALGDVITSETSTVSREIDDLNKMITLLDGISQYVGEHADKNLSGSTVLVGRLMHLFARNRVYNFHGEPGARLNVDQSIHATAQTRTLLVRTLSPLLFYAPDVHLSGLKAIGMDGIIRRRGWADYVRRLIGEWQEFILYATVVLNANVAFLAISSVDNNGASAPNRSAAQISSYLSILTSIGSIIVGLLLTNHHRGPEFSLPRIHPISGRETRAILYGLPYALLIWSMVAFIAAFSFMCFTQANLLSRILVACVWIAVAALTLWCIVYCCDWDWLGPLMSRLGFVEEGAASSEKDHPQAAVESTMCTESRSIKRWWTATRASITAILTKGFWRSEQIVTDV
ncbi:hypothetical protein R3P38DRAFT_3255270 [Favolaschia claudopus]|uniref:Uncharacterized protein n=1 Tax=Favolaschia claudopus TaxID=2862362 RepID=A0AAW0DGU2_9AGAR